MTTHSHCTWTNEGGHVTTSAMTVAAVDRLVDHSTLIQINGESYRRRRARRVGGQPKS